MIYREIFPGIETLLTWPCTPDKQRVQRAANALEGSGDWERDAGADSFILEAIQENLKWQDWAINTFIQNRSPDHGVTQIIRMMSQIARDGDEENTIGLALENRNLDYAPHQTALAFGLIPRDPEWIGFCTQFTNVKNLSAIIGESQKEEGRIGTIVCCTSNLMEDLRKEAKTGQPDPRVPGWAELLHILQWHGAAEIYWAPQQNNDLVLFPIQPGPPGTTAPGPLPPAP